MHLLDVHPHADGRHVVAWVLGDDGAERVEVPFWPRFHVTSHGAPLDEVEDALDRFHVASVSRIRAVPGLAPKPREALRVEAPTTHRRHLARLVDRMGRHRRYRLWDVDVRPTHQFMLDRGLWPLAEVTRDDGLSATGNRWDLDRPLPDLDCVELDVETPVATNLLTRDRPLDGVVLEDTTGRRRLDGPEDAVLLDLQEALDARDPDVVFTRGGDPVLVRYLHARARVHGVDLRLGRDPDPTEPLRGDRSFWTYGRVEYQPRVEVLHGRLHLDRSSSFFLMEAGFHGLVDLARLTSTPVQQLARLGAGTAVTALQIDRAKREGRLVPEAKARPETFKTEAELVRADRGGLTHDPIVGVHGPVLELDYASMYPNVMIEKNVSPETIGCGCCDPGAPGVRTVPGLGWHTCRKRGFISRALEPLVARRAQVKDRLREAQGDRRRRLQQVCDAMKWLCVCSFGYQGFKNARFGRIECHESICAWGRASLVEAFRIARDRGYEVVHALVDSVYLVPRRDDATDAETLAGEIGEAVGLPIDVEGWYHWVAFCPTRETARDPARFDVGALTRFFGLRTEVPKVRSRAQAGQPRDTLAGGRLKVRGVEMRQRSTPPVVSRVQEAALERWAEETTPEAVREATRDALRAARPVVDRIGRGDTGPGDLVVARKLTRALGDYRVRTLASDAARVLQDEGREVQPGEQVRFVVRDADGDRPEARVRPADLGPPDRIDRDWYRDRALHALVSLVSPMGWGPREVEAAVQGQEIRRIGRGS